MRQGVMNRIKHLLRDVRGTAAVEFAFIAPVMILLYFGMAEVTQGLLTDRRVNQATATIGDLIAQSKTLTKADIQDIFNVSGLILRPAPISKLNVRVVSVTMDAQRKTAVAWTETKGSAAGMPAPLSDVPQEVLDTTDAGGSFIRADTSYTFTSTLQSVLPQPIVFRHVMFLRPRETPVIPVPK